ncbi:hypothetical protein ANN_06867 [Periplaneta americana]|uniref:HTH psq-type domain-containing protein n=1 Tax=Periplaneta americana TaxID=6978 RepID=A0ABQ8TGK0_PERAM|nr:hypothetical protein ANN_06867 [Periplaneta americana]
MALLAVSDTLQTDYLVLTAQRREGGEVIGVVGEFRRSDKGERSKELRKRLVKCFVWNAVLCGTETWTLRRSEEKGIEVFEMWIWRRIKRVKWTERVRNEAVLERVDEERIMLKLIRKRKRNWLGHWLRRNYLLKDALEGMVNGRRVRGRRRYQMIAILRHNGSYEEKQIVTVSFTVPGIAQSMVGKYKRKTNFQSWSKDSMQRAIQAVENKEMGRLKAAKQYGVPHATLRRRVSNGKNKILRGTEKGLGRYKCTFDKNLERELVDHIKLLESRMFGLTATEEKGWMTGEVFLQWLEHFCQHVKPSLEDKILLVLDGHSSHKNLDVLEYAKTNGVILVCLPPHCTHRMQPLDVAFFGPFKIFYDQEITRWLKAHPVALRRQDCPVNTDIFEDHQFAPSETTDRPKEPANADEFPSSSTSSTNAAKESSSAVALNSSTTIEKDSEKKRLEFSQEQADHSFDDVDDVDDDDDDEACLYCNDVYSQSKPKETWFQCVKCKMWAHPKCAGEWRKLYNAKLHALYSSPNVIRNIKSRRLRWTGHIARMGESRNANRVLVGRPQGKRPLGGRGKMDNSHHHHHHHHHHQYRLFQGLGNVSFLLH